MSIGDIIRSARERLGWSQADLARRLGVSKTAVGNWESGLSAPKRRRAEEVAKVLGLRSGDIGFSYEIGLEHLDPTSGVVSIPIVNLSDCTETVVNNLDSIQEFIPVLSFSIDRARRHLAFRVDTNDMYPEINRGDVILTAISVTPVENDFVLAVVANQIVLRKYRPRGNDSSGFPAFDLISPNPDLPTITVNSANPGKVLATIMQHHRMRSVHS